MIPIFCINLDRAKERRQSIQNTWIDKLGLNVIFWKAYDRRNICDKNTPYVYCKDKSVAKIHRELNDGEIACATSHCQLLEYALKLDIKEMIVMEDDIVPLIETKDMFFDQISFFKEEFNKPLALLQNINPLEYTRIQEKVIEKKQHFSLCGLAPCGTSLFYINQFGMKILLNELKNMYCPADYVQRDFFSKNQLVCISNKPLGYHEWNGDSYIPNNFRRIKRKYIE